MNKSLYNQNITHFRRYNNGPMLASRSRSQSVKVAYSQNLKPSEVKHLAGVKEPTSPNPTHSNGLTDASVYLLSDVSANDKPQFDVINNSKDNVLHVLDPSKYAEVSADALFTHKSNNAEIYNRLRGKIVECLETKRNYTQMIIGSGKTGKTNLLLNKPLLDSYGNPQVSNETRDLHAGLVQRALSEICTHLKQKGEADKEVMISIVGFHEDRVIDLLNLDQNIDSIQRDNLKIKSESNIGISVEDLIQMSIWSYSEFVSVYRIFSFMMEILKKQIGMCVKAYAIQIAVAKVSDAKDFIERVEQKFTFVRVSNCTANLRVLSNIGFCMGALSKRSSSGGCCVPYRSSRLTYYLKDCLTSEAHVSLLATITNKDTFKSQITTLQLARLFGKRASVKKNYLYDHAFLEFLSAEHEKNQYEQEMNSGQTGSGAVDGTKNAEPLAIHEIVRCISRYQALSHRSDSSSPQKQRSQTSNQSEYQDTANEENKLNESIQKDEAVGTMHTEGPGGETDKEDVNRFMITKEKLNLCRAETFCWKGKKRERSAGGSHNSTKSKWLLEKEKENKGSSAMTSHSNNNNQSEYDNQATQGADGSGKKSREQKQEEKINNQEKKQNGLKGNPMVSRNSIHSVAVNSSSNQNQNNNYNKIKRSTNFSLRRGTFHKNP